MAFLTPTSTTATEITMPCISLPMPKRKSKAPTPARQTTAKISNALVSAEVAASEYLQEEVAPVSTDSFVNFLKPSCKSTDPEFVELFEYLWSHFYFCRELKGLRVAAQRHFNAKKVGEQATYLDNYGYRYLQIKRRTYKEHQIVWAMFYGEPAPKGFDLDHINQDKADNRPENLRIATRSQNNQNSGLRVDNSSGTRGVGRYCRRGAWYWEGYVSFDGVKCTSPTYKEDVYGPEEAERLAKAWRDEKVRATYSHAPRDL